MSKRHDARPKSSRYHQCCYLRSVSKLSKPRRSAPTTTIFRRGANPLQRRISWRRRWHPLWALPVLLAASLGVLAGVHTPKIRGRWVELQEAHFQLFSNADPAETEHFAQRLVRFRQVFSQLLPGFQQPSTKSTRIYLFRRASSFKHFANLLGAPGKIDALFVATKPVNFILVLMDKHSDSAGLLYHEYLHEVVAETASDIPLWLNEGLAEFFSTFWSNGSQAEVGLANPDYLYLLRSEPRLDFRHLLSVAPRSPDYREPGPKSLFHAQSWLLVHYLITSGIDLRTVIPAYREHIVAGMEPAAAFAMALSTDETGLARALVAHLALKPLPSLKIHIKGAGRTQIGNTRPMAREEIFFRFGELLSIAARHRAPEAEAYLHAALATNPNHEPALAALAALLTREGRGEEARAILARARTQAPDDPSLLYLEGNRLLQPFLAQLANKSPSREHCPEAVRQAREAYFQAVTLQPEAREAYAGIARSCLFGPPDDPICAQEFGIARHRFPGDGEIAYLHMRFLLRQGRRDDARERLDELRRAAPASPWIARGEKILATSQQEGTLLGPARSALGGRELLADRLRLGRVRPELDEPLKV